MTLTHAIFHFQVLNCFSNRVCVVSSRLRLAKLNDEMKESDEFMIGMPGGPTFWKQFVLSMHPYKQVQSSTKVMSDSPGLVDFPVRQTWLKFLMVKIATGKWN